MSKPMVYLNGQFIAQDQAFVSVTDRGFIFGDGVYELIPVYGGRPFRLDQHLERLERSLQGIRLPNPLTAAQWSDMMHQLIELNADDGDQSIYLQITRGPAQRDHAFPTPAAPTVFATISPLKPVADALLQQGASAITLDDIRWLHCHIKAISLLPNILLRQQAVDVDAQEAILIRDGKITEGAASNVFIVKDGTLKTPPKTQFLLPGITRDLVLELARDSDLACEEAQITPEELRQADEIWLSSSTKEVLPVTRLNNQPVGNGQPGACWGRMRKLYQAYKRQLAAGEVE